MKKIVAIILVFLLAVSLLVACGGTNKTSDDYHTGNGGSTEQGSSDLIPAAPDGGLYENDSSNEYASPPSGDSAETNDNPAVAGPDANSNANDYGLKIIYMSSLSIETLDYDASYGAIMAQLKKSGGYISYSDQQGGGTANGYVSARYAEFEFRIPVNNYEAFLEASDGFGSIISRNDTTHDVTASYADLEARITALKTQEERLLELLAMSNDLDMLLRLEDKLAQVRYEIEGYMSTLNRYDDLISFCTVTIYLREVSVITPVSEKTFWQETWETIQGSLRLAGDFLKAIFFILLYVLPYLLIALVVFLIVRPFVKKGKAKRAEIRAAQMAATPYGGFSQPPVDPNHPAQPKAIEWNTEQDDGTKPKKDTNKK